MLNGKQFTALYHQYLESGLTVRGYCANQNIKESLFYYWQNRLRDKLPPKRGFVPVVFEKEKFQSSQILSPDKNGSNAITDPGNTNQSISCEITYPNGVSIKLNGTTDLRMLRSLLFLSQQ